MKPQLGISSLLLFLLPLLPLTTALPDQSPKATPIPNHENPSIPEVDAQPSTTEFAIAGHKYHRRYVDPRAVSPTLASVDGYAYIGCYNSGGNPLSVTHSYDSGMLPDLCRNICSVQNCPMFAVGNGYHCSCGTTLEAEAATAEEAKCIEGCYGDKKQLCGANKALNVYSATVGFEGIVSGKLSLWSWPRKEEWHQADTAKPEQRKYGRVLTSEFLCS